MKRPLSCGLALLAFLLLFGGDAPAQRSAGKRLPRGAAQVRNREEMHPGRPLDLIGLEEGDNDFRAQTPALTNSQTELIQVDQDELYRQRLAMYEQGARFDGPPPMAPGYRPRHLIQDEELESTAPSGAQEEVATQGNWMLGAAITMLVTAFLVLRRGSLFGG